MSVVAWARSPRGWAIGSDTAGHDGGTRLLVGSKLVPFGNQVVVGVVGVTAHRTWLRRLGERAPALPGSAADLEDFACRLDDAMFAWAKERGHTEATNGQTSMGCHLLVAGFGECVRLDGGNGAVQVVGDYTAIGYGAPEALGAFHALDRAARVSVEPLTPAMRVRIAVTAATTHSQYCGGPPDVLDVPRRGEST